MLRTVFLCLPIFISLFWAITLNTDKKSHSIPRSFLAKFMLLPLVCYISWFFNFEHLPDIFIFFDIPLAFAGSLILPVYHIYFRLLTVDEKFSLKAHGRFLAVPLLVALIYTVGVLSVPIDEYKAALVERLAYKKSPNVNFIYVLYIMLILHFLVQAIVTVVWNSILIRKYSDRAEQFYSNVQDGKYNNARMLNYSIVIAGVAAFVAQFVFKLHLFPQEASIYAIWLIISVMLYVMGYMGFSQKPINPYFDLAEKNSEQELGETISIDARKKIIKKMRVLFEEEKIYLNSQLNIMDVVLALGTNRTYISSIINQQYKQNFCSYVNNYRYLELVKLITINPECSFDTLVECCGFGSLSSLKRVVFAQTGMSLQEWKQKQLKSA